MRSVCIQAQRIRIATVGNNVEIVLNGIRVIARKNKDVRVGTRLCSIRVIVLVELAGAGGRVFRSVLIDTVFIDSANVGVGVMIVGAGARRILDGRGEVNVHAIAEQKAIGCVGVGSAHSKTARRTRSHIG